MFGWLVASAGGLALAVGAAFAALGPEGAGTLAGTIVGAVTACVFFFAALDRIPLGALLLGALALASAGGFLRTTSAYRRERRLLAALPLRRATDARLVGEAAAAGIELFVTPARRPGAFCFGPLRPRVVVTSGLLERLSAEEQRAVLWHEAEHARNRDPLRCLLARTAANTFFWFPLLRALLERFLLVKELAADERAVTRTSTAALAGALSEVVGRPALAAVGAGELAAARIDRLFSPETPLPPLFRRWQLAASGAGALALALALSLPSRIDVGERTRLDMLTSLSLHGLPGMAAGLVLNLAVLAIVAYAWRRLARRRDGVRRTLRTPPARG